MRATLTRSQTRAFLHLRSRQAWWTHHPSLGCLLPRRPTQVQEPAQLWPACPLREREGASPSLRRWPPYPCPTWEHRPWPRFPTQARRLQEAPSPILVCCPSAPAPRWPAPPCFPTPQGSPPETRSRRSRPAKTPCCASRALRRRSSARAPDWPPTGCRWRSGAPRPSCHCPGGWPRRRRGPARARVRPGLRRARVRAPSPDRPGSPRRPARRKRARSALECARAWECAEGKTHAVEPRSGHGCVVPQRVARVHEVAGAERESRAARALRVAGLVVEL